MIVIGSDHAGFDLKNYLKKYLIGKGYQIIDIGTYNKESVDTIDIALPLAKEIVDGTYEKGILICGSGVGVSIIANKLPGIRAVLASNSYLAKTSREHNDTNVLCLGARVIGKGIAEDIVLTWLKTDFDDEEKRIRRKNRLIEFEKNFFF